MRSVALCLAVAFSLALAACSPSVDYASTISTSQALGTPLLKITNDGVGGISSDTRYGQKTIEAALPGFTTEGLQSAVETRTEWAIAAFSSDGFQVLQVFKAGNGKVRTVHGTSDHLEGPNGERIGMSLDELGIHRRDCRVGEALWRGMAICKAKNAPNVELVFSIPQFMGPFDKLPSNEELDSAYLQRILWTPKA